MADSKITALTALTAADPANDMIPIVDVSDTPPASGNTKRISINNLLACSPSATLASATISGDLTVATSALKVVSASSRVLINQASAIQGDSLEVSAKSDGGTISLFGRASDNGSTLSFRANGVTTQKASIVGSDSGLSIRTGTVERYQIDTTGVSTWSVAGTTAMTLNSTGLGIGVTPSAWASGYKAIQGQIGGFALSNDNSSNNQFRLSSNAYFDTTDSRWEYYGASTATAYEQRAGEHRFFNAVSGSANTLIPFVQAMTLDASGNLLVGTTTNGGNGVSIRPSTAAPNVVLVGSDISGGTSWQLYSTGTSSNRFYVTWGGVVNAVNTTISGISDARLKENVQDIDVGLGAILALKPRKFDWKAGKGKDIKGDRGFIAQEFEQVFPQLVDEWADPAPEGEAPYKSVRQDLIPVLVKAIQELTARVQTLETR